VQIDLAELGRRGANTSRRWILAHADVGDHQQTIDAETTPLRESELYRHTSIWLRCLGSGGAAAWWRRCLLDLTAQAFVQSDDRRDFAGRISDSGKGAGRRQAET
jgi:6-phosphogluconate dehydrogenase